VAWRAHAVVCQGARLKRLCPSPLVSPSCRSAPRQPLVQAVEALQSLRGSGGGRAPSGTAGAVPLTRDPRLRPSPATPACDMPCSTFALTTLHAANITLVVAEAGGRHGRRRRLGSNWLLRCVAFSLVLSSLFQGTAICTSSVRLPFRILHFERLRVS
jgi:hypothetical protein